MRYMAAKVRSVLVIGEKLLYWEETPFGEGGI
jgi:hypothetical protein